MTMAAQKPAPKFAVGARVAWSHAFAGRFGAKAVMTRDGVRALDPSAVFGTVTAIANEPGTNFAVTFDEGPHATDLIVPDDNQHVLTADELIAIEE